VSPDQSPLGLSPPRRTRDRILDTALQLFNEQGAHAVSTNHVCAALGMSPGNLYYHFRNRADIVRALFARYSERFAEVLAVPDDRTLTYEDKVGYFEAIFDTLWHYRFLHRDIDPLLREDAGLREPWRQFAGAILRDGRRVLGRLAEAGILLASDEQLDGLIINIWVLVTAWSGTLLTLSDSHAGAPVLDQSLLKRGIWQVICMEEPFLAPEVRARLPDLKAQYLGNAGTSPDALFGGLADHV
jgi:AcrR family transcriptional regulator